MGREGKENGREDGYLQLEIHRVERGLPKLSTIAIRTELIPCCGGCRVPWKMASSIPGLHPPHIPPPEVVTIQNASRHGQINVPWRVKITSG